MTPDLNQIDFYKVLFWVAIVLVAGFIGQFGKSFAKYIMERFGGGKSPRPSEPEPANRSITGQKQDIAGPPDLNNTTPVISGEESKTRKKEIKAELKRRKKENK
jgi:hypothetical protein